MGELKKGYLGPVTGKLGTGIGTYTNGRNIIKSLPIVKKASTESQVEQQTIFKMVANFLEPLTILIKKTIPKIRDLSGYNQALKQIIEEAVSGTPPVINYSLVQVGKGKLLNEGAAVVAAAGTLTFNWTINTDDLTAFADDRSVPVVYCESLKRVSFNINGSARSTGTTMLNLPAAFSGKQVQTWILFMSADGKQTSDSIFTGAVMAL